MKRSAPLQRKTPLRSRPGKRPCPVCGYRFDPDREGQRVCGYLCATRKVQADKKVATKSVAQREEECRRIVQAIARIRDRHDGCISCHMGPGYRGAWHGSHYRSVGACSALQFHLWNIHKACAQCNFYKGGNREGYLPRLIAKIGQAKVEWLDAQNQVRTLRGVDYDEYLARFKRVMGKRLRRMKKRAEA